MRLRGGNGETPGRQWRDEGGQGTLFPPFHRKHRRVGIPSTTWLARAPLHSHSAALPVGFVEEHGCRAADVERINRVRHGDSRGLVAGRQDSL